MHLDLPILWDVKQVYGGGIGFSPELRNYLLASANFDPVDFLVKITQGRANRQQITSILDNKIIDLEAVKEEQKLLASPKPKIKSAKEKDT
jgi:hypothetical protein